MNNPLTTCGVCGSQVIQHNGSEGTGCYLPLMGAEVMELVHWATRLAEKYPEGSLLETNASFQKVLVSMHLFSKVLRASHALPPTIKQLAMGGGGE